MQNQQRGNKKEIKYLKKGEWKKLLDCVDKFRDMVIIELLYETGCRVGELAKMDIQDINFEAGFIRILAENTKTKVGRTVYIPKGILSKVKAYLVMTRKKKGLLFGLTKRRIQQLVKKYSDISGIACSAHTLRHSHVVHALMDKIPISAVQKQVGHKRLESTAIYTDLAPEQVKEAYQRREK
ncbi:MAG: tyrosine-type recombinase/integrase [Clostridia bacterium]|jgi:integrase|nr:tyrosine-type recombinase/integrase [Clostridia bacterium]